METFGVLTKYPDSVALIEFALGSVWLWEFRIVSTPCHCSYISVVSSERTGALGLGVALRHGSTAILGTIEYWVRLYCAAVAHANGNVLTNGGLDT